MMKKKIIVTIILALTLCASMTGCGAEKENTPAVLETPDVVATEEAAETETVPEEEVKEQEAVAEILDADIYSKKIQLGNQVFTVPVTLEDIIASGAVVTDTEVKPTDTVYSTKMYTSIKLDIDGFSYSLPFVKTIDTTEETIQLNKAKLDSLMECTQDVILPKGMKIGKTVDDLVAAWGTPNSDIELHPDKYIYQENPDSDEYVLFHIDLNTNTIDYIAFFYHKM